MKEIEKQDDEMEEEDEEEMEDIDVVLAALAEFDERLSALEASFAAKHGTGLQ